MTLHLALRGGDTSPGNRTMGQNLQIASINGQMICRKMRISQNHVVTPPTAKFLKDMQWRTSLHVLTGPCMSQVGPSEVLYGTTLQRFIPSCCRCVLDALSVIGENESGGGDVFALMQGWLKHLDLAE